jgi:hypothetical protein
MATDGDKIGERYRKQRREKPTKKGNPAEIDNGNAGSYGYKADEPENPFAIQKVLQVH